MEQRRVRLGDVLDDYCPRERRVTNHAVVAIVDNDIKLTRCTTCDTEHPYKAARVPPRRQTRLVAALSNPGADGALIAAPPASPAPAAMPPAAPLPAAASSAVAPRGAASPGVAPPSARPLAAGPSGVTPPSARPLAAGPSGVAPPVARPLAAGSPGVAPLAARPLAAAPPGVAASDATLPDVPLPVVSRPPQPAHVDSVRRPLIRATLGRPDPAVASRTAPVFTMRENEGRAGSVDRGNASRRRRNGSRPGRRAEREPGGGASGPVHPVGLRQERVEVGPPQRKRGPGAVQQGLVQEPRQEPVALTRPRRRDDHTAGIRNTGRNREYRNQR